MGMARAGGMCEGISLHRCCCPGGIGHCMSVLSLESHDMVDTTARMCYVCHYRYSKTAKSRRCLQHSGEVTTGSVWSLKIK